MQTPTPGEPEERHHGDDHSPRSFRTSRSHLTTRRGSSSTRKGPFITGGPSVHSGLTGRKNAIDTYGEYSRHSGAALSGKDPLRIDRVGAYAARYAAKNIVAARLADECEIQLSYSIGIARPVSVQVETFGTGRMPDEKICASVVESNFDFRIASIVRALQSQVSALGRQGRLLQEAGGIRACRPDGHRPPVGENR
jgi:S-adenosylmethionine synthetase